MISLWPVLSLLELGSAHSRRPARQSKRLHCRVIAALQFLWLHLSPNIGPLVSHRGRTVRLLFAMFRCIFWIGGWFYCLPAMAKYRRGRTAAAFLAIPFAHPDCHRLVADRLWYLGKQPFFAIHHRPAPRYCVCDIHRPRDRRDHEEFKKKKY